MDMSHKRRFYAGMVGGVVVLSWLVITSCSGKWQTQMFRGKLIIAAIYVEMEG